MSSPRGLSDVYTSSMPGVPALGQRLEVGINEYIFLKGVANTVAGMWVTFDEVGVTTLLAANAEGPVAVAMAAIDATTKFGWYQIFGTASGRVLADAADNAWLYATATAGVADDAVVAGDLIHNAKCRALNGGSTGNVTVQLYYPYVEDAEDVGT